LHLFDSPLLQFDSGKPGSADPSPATLNHERLQGVIPGPAQRRNRRIRQAADKDDLEDASVQDVAVAIRQAVNELGLELMEREA
jgi:hypothetical protein